MGSRRRPVVVVAAAVLFAVTLAWRFLTFTGFSNDHYATLALAQQMLLGDWPIRDFSDPGWPLAYVISAAAWLAAGDAMWTEWAIMAVAFAIGAACTVVVGSRLSHALWIAVLIAAIEILIHPRTYAYPKVVPYAAGAWAMLAIATRPSRPRMLLMAAIVTIAFLLRHDHGLFIGLAAAVCVAVASRAGAWRVATQRVAFLTGAVAACLLPWMVFVTLNGGLIPYFQTALEYAQAEANASNLRSWPALHLVPGEPLLGLAPPNRPLAQVEWTADLPDDARVSLESKYGLEYVRKDEGTRFYHVRNTAPDNLRALADDPHVAGTSGLGRVGRPVWREFLASLSPLRLAPALHHGANADAWLFWLFWSLPLVTAGILVHRVTTGREAWPGELAVVAALMVLAVLVNAGFLRDILRTRFSDAIVPAALLGGWLLGLCWTGRWRRRVVQVALQAASIVVLGVTVAAVGHVADLPERFARTGIDDGLDGIGARAQEVSQLLDGPHRQAAAPPSRYSGALIPFFDYLDRCTDRSARLIVTGEFPDILVLAGRRFAGDGVVFGAWYSSIVHQDRTIERLRVQRALFALHMDDYSGFQRRFPSVDAYLRAEYKPMAEIPVQGAGNIQVLVHKMTPAGRPDPETGWPCFRT